MRARESWAGSRSETTIRKAEFERVRRLRKAGTPDDRDARAQPHVVPFRPNEARGATDRLTTAPSRGREITGALAGIVVLGQNDKQPARVSGGLQVSVVAGTRSQRCLHLLQAR
jgi:hypothetical protein